MKIKILEALKNGIGIPIKNPIIFVPAVIGAILALTIHLIPEPSTYSISSLMAYLSAVLLWTLVFIAIFIFLNNMIIRMVYDATQKKLSLSNAFKTAAIKYPYVFLSTVLYSIIVGVGSIFLIVPGIFFAIALFYYECAILIDNKGIIDSLKYSWDIIKNNWWLTLALLLIFYVPYLILLGACDLVGLFIRPLSILLEFLVNICYSSWLTSTFTIAYLQLTRE